MLCHSQDLILTRLLKNLRVQFANNTPVLKLLDEYLLTQVTKILGLFTSYYY